MQEHKSSIPLRRRKGMLFGGGRGLGLLSLLLALAFLRAACAPAPTTPSPLTDDAGRTISLAQRPQRIVSLAPSSTEILYALGAGDRVVAVTDFCDYPPEAKAKPKVGGMRPSLERIVAYQPDLVLATGGNEGLAASLVDKGIAAAFLDPKDLEGVYRNISLVGRLVGAEGKAQALIQDMQRRQETVMARVKDAPKVRAFYELDASGDATRPWTAGPGSFIHDLILMAGGENVAARAPRAWIQFSTEELVRQDPQVILMADARYGVTPEQVAQRPAWGGLTAIKQGAIFAVDPDLTNRPGPRLIQGLEELARLLHPELFRAQNP